MLLLLNADNLSRNYTKISRKFKHPPTVLNIQTLYTTWALEPPLPLPQSLLRVRLESDGVREIGQLNDKIAFV
jgi:hypothetical protein